MPFKLCVLILAGFQVGAGAALQSVHLFPFRALLLIECMLSMYVIYLQGMHMIGYSPIVLLYFEMLYQSFNILTFMLSVSDCLSVHREVTGSSLTSNKEL